MPRLLESRTRGLDVDFVVPVNHVTDFVFGHVGNSIILKALHRRRYIGKGGMILAQTLGARCFDHLPITNHFKPARSVLGAWKDMA